MSSDVAIRGGRGVARLTLTDNLIKLYMCGWMISTRSTPATTFRLSPKKDVSLRGYTEGGVHGVHTTLRAMDLAR